MVRLLDLLTNIRLGWIYLTGTNTLAYFTLIPMSDKKASNFDYTAQCYKFFTVVIYKLS
jgi:hypothetical protein